MKQKLIRQDMMALIIDMSDTLKMSVIFLFLNLQRFKPENMPSSNVMQSIVFLIVRFSFVPGRAIFVQQTAGFEAVWWF